MSVTPEKFVASVKAEFEAGIEAGTSATSAVMGAVEKVSALNISTVRSADDEGASYAKALADVKEPKALLDLQLGLLNPGTEQGLAYARALTAIGNETKDTLTKLYEAQASALAGKFTAALDEMFKNAPAGSEAAVDALKSAIASAGSNYEQAAKVAKELAETAQSNFENATNVAVENLTKNAKAMASAVKSAS